jgi:Permeases of the drug/metabolite transporter (DMT) superfamily
MDLLSTVLRCSFAGTDSSLFFEPYTVLYAETRVERTVGRFVIFPEAGYDPRTRVSELTNKQTIVLFVCMTLIWGASYVFTSVALRSWTPIALVAFRLTIGAALLGGGVLARRLPMPRRIRTYLALAFLALVNVAVPFFLLTWAQTEVPAGLTSVLSSTTPIFVFLFAVAVHTDEHFDLVRLIGIVVAFTGVALLYGIGPATAPSHWWGPLLIILSSAVFGLGNVLTRLILANVNAIVAAFLQLGFAAAFLIPVAFLSGGVPTSMSVLSLAAAIELGVLGSGAGYALFFTLIHRWGSTRTALNTYLQPIVGVLLGIALLGERLTVTETLDMCVIFAGVAIFGAAGFIRWRRRRFPRSSDRAASASRERAR